MSLEPSEGMLPSPSGARARVLAAAHGLATAYLSGLGERSAWPRADIDEMLVALGEPLGNAGRDPAAVVTELARLAEPGISANAGARFFGFVVGASLPAALGADWLTSVWDQNAGLNALAPAAVAAEVVAGGWIVDLLGLPRSTSVGFVTGAMMANYTCLSAARDSVLAGHGWAVSTEGLFGAPPVRVFVGRHRHDAVDRAIRFLGLGQRAIVVVDADSQGRIEPHALERSLTQGAGPAIVCLQAGEVHTGAFDPFAEAVLVARRHGAWVHVDGAFGLWAAASPLHRSLTEGMVGADSWATDAHKTLNVPYDSGLALVRDPATVAAGFGVHADYLIDGVADPVERVPELSRRARGFAVWAALRSLGRTGVADLVDGLCARATQLADGLRDLPGIEVVNDVVFTQVMVAYGDDDRTAELGRLLREDGTIAVTPARWHGRTVQRFAVSSWATGPTDIEAAVAAVGRVAAGLRA